MIAASGPCSRTVSDHSGLRMKDVHLSSSRTFAETCSSCQTHAKVRLLDILILDAALPDIVLQQHHAASLMCSGFAAASAAPLPSTNPRLCGSVGSITEFPSLQP